MVAEVVVTTPRCPVCRNTAELRVPHANYRRFLEGAEVQVAFPDLDADQRELLISGTHAHCWATLWGPEDEE